jgi:hypothetical protein
MPIDLYWDDDEQTVLLCEFNGTWTWDELQKVLKTIKRLSEESGRVFGALVDVSKGITVPGGSIFNREALSQFQKMRQLGADGRGPVVIVGMNSIIRSIFDTVKRLDKSAASDVHFAATLAAGQQIIYPIMRRLNDISA